MTTHVVSGQKVFTLIEYSWSLSYHKPVMTHKTNVSGDDP